MKSLAFEVRSSPIEGLGAFATRPIPKGAQVVEYLGERISTEEGDARYNGSLEGPVLLFTVDEHIVIDAGVDGNEARFINHSCEPNCRAVLDKKRVFIEALRTIQPGEELTYDYSLTRDEEGTIVEEDYPCHCGAASCRGSMLEPLKKKFASWLIPSSPAR